MPSRKDLKLLETWRSSSYTKAALPQFERKLRVIKHARKYEYDNISTTCLLSAGRGRLCGKREEEERKDERQRSKWSIILRHCLEFYGD